MKNRTSVGIVALSMLWFSALCSATSRTTALQLAQSNPTPSFVWCHDVSRALVGRKAAWQCKGEVVSDAEAARIKNARVDRVKRALGSNTNKAIPGKRVRSTGTGFFVSADGHVLTNDHVVRGCIAITVTPPGQGERRAVRRASDTRRDLALLDAGQASPDFARFRDGDGARAGEGVTVVGYPNHGLVSIRPKLVKGTMLAMQPRNRPGIFAMHIDVRRGNSGGPVLDAAANVIGVVFAKVDTPSVYAKTGKVVRDIGLGIRPDAASSFLRGQGLRIHLSTAFEPLDKAARLRRASEFVVQVRCWK